MIRHNVLKLQKGLEIRYSGVFSFITADKFEIKIKKLKMIQNVKN